LDIPNIFRIFAKKYITNMIAHKDFESNCKRLAKHIVKHSIDIDVITSGIIVIDVSKALVDDFNTNRKGYEKEINKHLENKGGKILNGRTRNEDGWILAFNIEYDEVDAETEDW
jgi:hypothetical protein